MDTALKVLSGTAVRALATTIGQELALLSAKNSTPFNGKVPCVAHRFNDREPRVEHPENLRGADVFVVQSTHQPGNNLIELGAMLDAASRSDAGKITAVVPYFGYARQDRKVQPRVPITAAHVANYLYTSGAGRIITTDLHAGQIQGFTPFPPRPFDNLEALPVLLRQVAHDFGVTREFQFQEFAFVSPDDGGYARVRETGKLVNCGHTTLFKKGRDRDGRLVKNGGFVLDPALVHGRTCLLMDDLVATGGSLMLAAHALKEVGAKEVIVVVVHPVLSTDPDTEVSAYDLLTDSIFDRCYFADTIPFTEHRAVWSNTPQDDDEDFLDPERARAAFRDLAKKTTIVSLARLFAGAIHEIHTLGSVSSIFKRTCAEIFS